MISTLHLQNFRNYSAQEVRFCPGVNYVLGRNGQGKTNLLEAVYYLSLLRSFRTSNLNDLRQFQTNFFRLEGEIQGQDGLPCVLSVSYGSERRLLVDGTPVYRASDFINRFLCVTLIPEDLYLVQGGPALRRRFLDIAISQTSSEYFRHLQMYVEALHSRNVMLHHPEKYSRDTICAYDGVLAKHGAAIEISRWNFIRRINHFLAEFSSELLEDSRRFFSVKYFSKCGPLLQELQEFDQESIQNKIYEALKNSFEKDCRQAVTSIGPHRSDFYCLLDAHRMQHYSSQGECRLASLALRLACLRKLEEEIGLSRVTLLVDDVFGELDSMRRQLFFRSVQRVGQLLLACTELPSYAEKDSSVFHIHGGTVVSSC